MIAAPFTPKAPEDRLDYGVDFSDDLLPGETIASAAWSFSPPGLVLDGTSVSGTVASAWLTAGAPLTSYAGVVIAPTSQGRTLAAEVSLFVGPVGFDWGF